MTSEYMNGLEEILVQGSLAWDYKKYQRQWGDPKTRPLMQGCEGVNKAFLMGISSGYIRRDVYEMVPQHWFGVVAAMIGNMLVEFAPNEDGTAMRVSVMGVAKNSMPQIDRCLGMRFGRDLAFTLLASTITMKGLVDPDLILRESGALAADNLEIGVHMAWHGKVEDGARRISKAMTALFTTLASALALGALAKNLKASADKITRSHEVNGWVANLPSPLRNWAVAGENIGMKLEEVTKFAQRSRSTIQVARKGKGGKPVKAEIVSGGFRMAGLTPEDSGYDPEGFLDLSLMNRALFAYSKMQHMSDGPLLYGTLGRQRETGDPFAQEIDIRPSSLAATESLLVGVDGRVFRMCWPDVADLCHAMRVYGSEYLWSKGSWDFSK